MKHVSDKDTKTEGLTYIDELDNHISDRMIASTNDFKYWCYNNDSESDCNHKYVFILWKLFICCIR